MNENIFYVSKQFGHILNENKVGFPNKGGSFDGMFWALEIRVHEYAEFTLYFLFMCYIMMLKINKYILWYVSISGSNGGWASNVKQTRSCRRVVGTVCA